MLPTLLIQQHWLAQLDNHSSLTSKPALKLEVCHETGRKNVTTNWTHTCK